ncbi:hypothetical protein Btru_078102 [Bulinus truncatus]|nr:hypothetical protein Btru_078102 [Bulinus truncatus]
MSTSEERQRCLRLRRDSDVYVRGRYYALVHLVNGIGATCMDSLLPSEWLRLEEVVTLLEPFAVQTDILQSDTQSLSTIIPSLHSVTLFNSPTVVMQFISSSSNESTLMSRGSFTITAVSAEDSAIQKRKLCKEMVTWKRRGGVGRWEEQLLVSECP